MNTKLDIYLPVFCDINSELSFSHNGQNPGIGGTQFTTINLAFLLSREFNDLNLILINSSHINLHHPGNNLSQLIETDIDIFLTSLHEKSCNYLVIITASLLRVATPSLIHPLRNNIIAWVHHPFHVSPEISKLQLSAHVHVGTYQFYSNYFFYKNNWHIQNPFKMESQKESMLTKDSCSPVRIVYLGALIRAKGFGYIAQQWKQIKKIHPRIELHVIGSSATYGMTPTHNLLPCDTDFATEILSHIPLDDIESRQVVFYGNLGEEKLKVIRSSHIALLNPTGASEAFPASVLECMGCGIPVIASDDYGMSDSMRFFPELLLKSPKQITTRITWILDNPHRYKELSERATTVARWFDSQSCIILLRWRRLFDEISSPIENPILSDAPPIEPLYGSIFKLRYRQLRHLFSIYKQRFFH